MTAYKVLVVEDSPTMRQLIVFALKRIRGFQISEANDGCLLYTSDAADELR